MVVGLYQDRVYINDVFNKMGHIFERFKFLMRSKSFNKEQVEAIDHHLTEIMKILNKCN